MKLHDDSNGNKLDDSRWNEICAIKEEIMKDGEDKLSLFSRINRCIEEKEYESVSVLEKELKKKYGEVNYKYGEYKKNIFPV